MSFSEQLLNLRRKCGLSQEEFARRIDVTRKAVQNWEASLSIPDGKHLVNIAKVFDVSLDEILLGINQRSKEELMDKVLPTKNRHEWECYEKELDCEYNQTYEEGKDIQQYKGLFKEVSLMEWSYRKVQFGDVLYGIVSECKQRSDYAYYEPSDLEEIKEVTTSVERVAINRATIESKIRGAWLGRVCGCLLGKPIEGIRTKDLNILLKNSDNYPMKRYIRYTDINEKTKSESSFPYTENYWVDKIDAAPCDDDTNYTVMSSKIIDEYGRNFTPSNVLDAWLHYQPKDSYCTAERVAWRNYFNGYMPPHTAIYKNPYREWIGAQIRIDYFGYINAGDVESAVEMAFKDASISHTKNGIYGALFIASMIAYGAVCDDMMSVIEMGLSQIPKTSRLYENVSLVVKAFKNGKSEESVREMIHKMYDEYNQHHWCHTISNCMIVTMSLLYNQFDFGKAICSAVQTGFDTDCNGATVGSIFGIMRGASAISSEWTKPINNLLSTNIFGYDKVSIDTMVEKTLSHLKA